MVHFREQGDPRSTDIRNALDDARVLIERYQQRNNPERRLTPDQRRAWAEQMVVVLGKMGLLASAQVDKSDDDRHRRRLWVQSFAAGYRPVKPIPQDPPGLRVTTIGEQAKQHAAEKAAGASVPQGGIYSTNTEGGGRTHELIRRATAVFRSLDEASRWGDSPAPELGARTPVEVSRESAAGFQRSLVLLEYIRAAKAGATQTGGPLQRR